MRHRKRGKILSRKIGPRRALFRALIKNLILYGQIKTTEAKAKSLRPKVERLINVAKSGELVARRKLFAALQDDQLVKKVLEILAPQYKERRGGYTKIIKVGLRKGDAAKMAIIKFV